ncbi:fatty acid desaturase CarF family protein [Sphingobium algorifonticola]|uniref:Carotenoid synthesis regulator CarF n=1 Tax=Sphingobium algorifonticola TaxID=2008318 RepID=A0A437J4Y3_9SPHN|nr:fatty acid desaturase CarF family protein [Sphingobium algorifonticola]RVT39819.1 carotenoid synthesis regulator CarF [Sphingobium algorifonticola]
MLMRFVLALFFVSLAANAAFALRDPSLWAIPAMLLGWYVADMLSGAVHMYMDYRPCVTGVGLDRLYFYPGSRESDEYQAMFRAAMARINPLERLVYDFKNHHPRPDALGRRGVVRLIGSTVLAGALPLSLLMNGAAKLWPVPGWAMAGMVALLIGGAFAQYFHGTLHRAQNVWIVRAMRRAGLLMTPQAHQLHHDTLRRDFSTNCGWSNPLLNRLFALAYRRRWLRDDGLEPVG